MGGGMTQVNASLFPLPPNPLPALMDDSLREEKAEEWSDAVDQTPSHPSLSPPPVDEADAGGNHNPTFTGRSHPNLPPPPPEPPAEVVLVEGDNYDHLNQEDEEDEENGHPLETPSSPSPETLKPPAAIHPPSDDDDDDDEAFAPAPKKQKPLAAFTSPSPPSPVDLPTSAAPAVAGKKPKKKNNNVWTKSTSRKGKKKTKNAPQVTPEDTVLITPIPRFPDKSDDSPESQICLSRVYKAEKVELSEDRLSAGSTKGYRMVRATRGVVEGAWYFEIRVVRLGETGHSRLGWTTEKGDLQAPVGYDGNSFGYRDVDGTKVHKALRERYGNEGFFEGDVIGFYISLPEGELYAPKPPHLVWFKGQRYMYSADGKDEPPKVVPGSEISFFKNGVCQGVAFTGLFGGRYYPAASMYTLPNQPNCEVRFNFGPDFEFFPQNFGDRPIPRPLIEVPYHGYDGRESRVEVPAENGLSEKAN